MKLGQKLKEARLNAGLKQEELANQLGVSRQTVSNWENDRSYPDLGSTVKLSNLYGRSLDELLKDDDSVIRAFEDLARRRRKFWQMMLEIGIILQLVGFLLLGLEYAFAAMLFAITGMILLYAAILMHLRVFDHDRGQILRGAAGVFVHMVCAVLGWLEVQPGGSDMVVDVLRLGAILLIWSAGVWTIDWKSTRLWLIIVLYIGAPFLTIGKVLQDTGNLNTANPFGDNYQVAQILYPKEMEVDEYTKVRLGSSLMYLEDRNGDSTFIGSFEYIEPTQAQTQLGIWQLVPEEDSSALYKLTVEADETVILAYYEQEILQWKWLLTDYGRDTCAITVPTFGSTMHTMPEWYAPGRSDPEPYLSRPDVVGSATLNITVGDLDTETLTLYEEYHHGGVTETAAYTLEPKRTGSFTLKLETRYDGENEWALYRIPYEDGEYRFTLTYGK